jgi:hypothetical protein
MPHLRRTLRFPAKSGIIHGFPQTPKESINISYRSIWVCRRKDGMYSLTKGRMSCNIDFRTNEPRLSEPSCFCKRTKKEQMHFILYYSLSTSRAMFINVNIIFSCSFTYWKCTPEKPPRKCLDPGQKNFFSIPEITST